MNILKWGAYYILFRILLGSCLAQDFKPNVWGGAKNDASDGSLHGITFFQANPSDAGNQKTLKEWTFADDVVPPKPTSTWAHVMPKFIPHAIQLNHMERVRKMNLKKEKTKLDANTIDTGVLPDSMNFPKSSASDHVDPAPVQEEIPPPATGRKPAIPVLDFRTFSNGNKKEEKTYGLSTLGISPEKVQETPIAFGGVRGQADPLPTVTGNQWPTGNQGQFSDTSLTKVSTQDTQATFGSFSNNNVFPTPTVEKKAQNIQKAFPFSPLLAQGTTEKKTGMIAVGSFQDMSNKPMLRPHGAFIDFSNKAKPENDIADQNNQNNVNNVPPTSPSVPASSVQSQPTNSQPTVGATANANAGRIQSGSTFNNQGQINAGTVSTVNSAAANGASAVPQGNGRNFAIAGTAFPRGENLQIDALPPTFHNNDGQDFKGIALPDAIRNGNLVASSNMVASGSIVANGNQGNGVAGTVSSSVEAANSFPSSQDASGQNINAQSNWIASNSGTIGQTPNNLGNTFSSNQGSLGQNVNNQGSAVSSTSATTTQNPNVQGNLLSANQANVDQKFNNQGNFVPSSQGTSVQNSNIQGISVSQNQGSTVLSPNGQGRFIPGLGQQNNNGVGLSDQQFRATGQQPVITGSGQLSPTMNTRLDPQGRSQGSINGAVIENRKVMLPQPTPGITGSNQGSTGPFMTGNHVIVHGNPSNTNVRVAGGQTDARITGGSSPSGTINVRQPFANQVPGNTQVINAGPGSPLRPDANIGNMNGGAGVNTLRTSQVFQNGQILSENTVQTLQNYGNVNNRNGLPVQGNQGGNPTFTQGANNQNTLLTQSVSTMQNTGIVNQNGRGTVLGGQVTGNTGQTNQNNQMISIPGQGQGNGFLNRNVNQMQGNLNNNQLNQIPSNVQTPPVQVLPGNPIVSPNQINTQPNQAGNNIQGRLNVGLNPQIPNSNINPFTNGNQILNQQGNNMINVNNDPRNPNVKNPNGNIQSVPNSNIQNTQRTTGFIRDPSSGQNLPINPGTPNTNSNAGNVFVDERGNMISVQTGQRINGMQQNPVVTSVGGSVFDPATGRLVPATTAGNQGPNNRQATGIALPGLQNVPASTNVAGNQNQRPIQPINGQTNIQQPINNQHSGQVNRQGQANGQTIGGPLQGPIINGKPTTFGQGNQNFNVLTANTQPGFPQVTGHSQQVPNQRPNQPINGVQGLNPPMGNTPALNQQVNGNVDLNRQLNSQVQPNARQPNQQNRVVPQNTRQVVMGNIPQNQRVVPGPNGMPILVNVEQDMRTRNQQFFNPREVPFQGQGMNEFPGQQGMRPMGNGMFQGQGMMGMPGNFNQMPMNDFMGPRGPMMPFPG